MNLGRYRQVLNTPQVARLFAAAVLSRLPLGINGLAMILFLREETGSFAIAGGVVAAFGAGAAVSNTLQGRLMDRHGQRRVLVPMVLAHAGFVAILVALVFSGAPTLVLVGCGFAMGSSFPSTGTAVRPLLPLLLRSTPQITPAAYAIDSIVIELAFIIGPLLTVLVTQASSAAAALGVGAVLSVGGVAALVSSPASRDWEPDRAASGSGGMLGALASPGVRTLACAALPVGFCLGATEVTLPAFADAMGSRETAGVLLAVWSVGSAVGGILYGAREPDGPLRSRYVRQALLFPAGAVLLVGASSPVVMGALLLIAGAAIAPLLSATNQLVGEVAPPGAISEAYTWPVTALVAGVSAGSAVAGALVEGPGWRTALAVASLGALAGAAVAIGRRTTLVAHPAAAG